jgi:hypothetical protein
MDPRVNLQFDYAWKWFDFHAKQRTSLFNFYIIVIGASLGAFAALTKVPVDKSVLNLVCYFGIGTSIIFLLLDFRNHRLVRYGELNLVYLEKTQIFPGEAEKVFYEDKSRPLGVLKQEYFRNTGAEKNREGYYDHLPFFLTHRFLIPLTFVAVILLFIALIVWVK